MRFRFFSPVLAILGVSAIAACGGKVIVDNPGAGGSGIGGNGGSSAHGPTTTVSTIAGPTTIGEGPVTTGPTCDCNTACADLEACFGDIPSCQQECDQIPSDLLACVCQTYPNCDAISQCSESSTSGSSGSGGSGGSGVSTNCSDCANNASESECSDITDACVNDTNCTDLINCNNACGWTVPCANQCAGQFFDDGTFSKLMSCLICQSCPQPCQNDEIFYSWCADIGTAPAHPPMQGY